MRTTVVSFPWLFTLILWSLLLPRVFGFGIFSLVRWLLSYRPQQRSNMSWLILIAAFSSQPVKNKWQSGIWFLCRFKESSKATRTKQGWSTQLVIIFSQEAKGRQMEAVFLSGTYENLIQIKRSKRRRKVRISSLLYLHYYLGFKRQHIVLRYS